MINKHSTLTDDNTQDHNEHHKKYIDEHYQKSSKKEINGSIFWRYRRNAFPEYRSIRLNRAIVNGYTDWSTHLAS